MIAAIDCGDNGAIAYGDKANMYVVKMPDSVGLYNLINSKKFKMVYVEEQRIRPSDLKNGSVYRIVDSLIRNFHEIELICKLTGTPYMKIEARRWQKPYNLPKEYTQRKSRAAKIAKRLYPGLKPTLKTADAILMLDYFLIIDGFYEIDKNRFNHDTLQEKNG